MTVFDRRQFLGAGSAFLLAGCAGRPFATIRREWELLPTVPYRGKQDDIAFADPFTGWYGNGEGRLYRTDSGGDDWREIWHQPGTYIRALAFLDREVGILGNVGPGVYPPGTDETPLYRTLDGGESWQPVAAIEGPRPAGICGIDIWRSSGGRTIVYAGGRVGGPAHYLQSRDGGESWQSQDLRALTLAIFDVKFVSEDVGFIAGTSAADLGAAHGVILKTEDGGTNWRRVFASARLAETVWKLSFPDARHGFGSIQNYDPDEANVERFICASDDGGDRWREIPVVSDHRWRAFGIGFLDDRRGRVGGTTGGFGTEDGGASWFPVEIGAAVNKFRFVPSPSAMQVFAIGVELHRLAIPVGRRMSLAPAPVHHGPADPGGTRRQSEHFGVHARSPDSAA